MGGGLRGGVWGGLDSFFGCVLLRKQEKTCVEFSTSETDTHSTNKLLLDRIDMRNQGQFWPWPVLVASVSLCRRVYVATCKAC